MFSWVGADRLVLCCFLKQRLARGPPDAAERVRVGEQVLNDRACQGAGGTTAIANVYGKDLLPYVPTTALALLALQNRRNEPAVVRGLEQLQRDVLSERSAVALSLAIICLRVYGRPTSAPEQQLTQLILDRHLSTRLVTTCSDWPWRCMRSATGHQAFTVGAVMKPSRHDAVRRNCRVVIFWRRALPLLAPGVPVAALRPQSFSVPERSSVGLFPAADYATDFADLVFRGFRELGSEPNRPRVS